MLKLLEKYLKRYKWTLLGDFVSVVAQISILTGVIIPKMKSIIDKGVGRNDMDFVIASGIRMLLLLLVVVLITIVASFLSARLVAEVVSDLRNDCYDKVLQMTPQDYNRFGNSTLLNRTITDGMNIQIMLINFMRTSLMVPVAVVAILVVLFTLNKTIFLILTVIFALTVGGLIYFGLKSRDGFLELQKVTDQINLLVNEKLTGVRPIRAFRNQKLEEDKMEQYDQDYFEKAIRANRTINFLAPVSLVVMNCTVVVIYLVGSAQLQAKLVGISDLLLALQYVGYLITSLAVIPVMVNVLPKASVSCDRILELLAFEPSQVKKEVGKTEGIGKGEVTFSHVIFGYSGAKEVIADVSFTAKAGKTTALIGVTGSGKTTIMNLLNRFYHLTFGEICIDGINIDEFDEDYLHRNIAFATQRPQVFIDTVRENIRMYDQTISDDRILEACDAAAFTEVLDKMPDGLDTMMALNGMNISGGQRQRMSIARTVCKDAPIYILDDTFSALDAKTDAYVRKALKSKLQGKTVLMIAQKINTIIDADRILVLEKGRIVGDGTHTELLKSCPLYQEIYRTQCYTSQGEEAEG